MILTRALPLAALLMLSACGGGNEQAENTADQLEEAAGQSDPAAAPILENAADAAEGANAAEANAIAQDALDQAGNAQAATLPEPQVAPPSMQAEPNRSGQQTPPPKTSTSPQ